MGAVAQASSPLPREVEMGGPTVQGHPLLQSEIEASLGYTEILCKKKDIKIPFRWPSLMGYLFCEMYCPGGGKAVLKSPFSFTELDEDWHGLCFEI